ncbi:UNVERIFIED_CONTAM: hypothetical protein Sindi_1294000 [Sesamum indicum]
MAAGDEEKDGDTPASDWEVGKVGGRQLVTGDGEKHDKPRQLFEEDDDLSLQSTGNFPANNDTPTLFETVALNQNTEECDITAEQTYWKEPCRLGFSPQKTWKMKGFPRFSRRQPEVPRPQLVKKGGNLDEEWTGTKLGFGAAIDAIDVVAAVDDDGSQRESENSPSAMSADDLGTGNIKETNRSPGNPRDDDLGQASMADGFHGDKDQPRFNFFEFLTLAHKVVDSGDVAAMAALSDLKQKWELQYGRPARFPVKTSRHVQPPIRRVVRCLLDDPAVPKQPLTNSNAAAEFTESAVEIQAFSAAFLAVEIPRSPIFIRVFLLGIFLYIQARTIA